MVSEEASATQGESALGPEVAVGAPKGKKRGGSEAPSIPSSTLQVAKQAPKVPKASKAKEPKEPRSTPIKTMTSKEVKATKVPKEPKVQKAQKVSHDESTPAHEPKPETNAKGSRRQKPKAETPVVEDAAGGEAPEGTAARKKRRVTDIMAVAAEPVVKMARQKKQKGL